MSLMKITISIPEEMNEWVKKQIQSGRFIDVSNYFSKLIELDMGRGRAEEQLRSLVDEGIKSGTSTLSIPEIMARTEKRAELTK